MNNPTSDSTPTRFDAETPMEVVMRSDPNLPVVLMRFHIGGCSLCGYEPADSIAKVAEDNGVPTAVLLAAIHGEPLPGSV